MDLKPRGGDLNMTGSATGMFTITPSDTEDLPHVVRGIRANTAGTVELIGLDGEQCTCNFLAGETRPIWAVRVLLSGTTATGLEGHK